MTTCHCTSRIEVPFNGFKVEGHTIHTPRACYHASLFPDLWALRSSRETEPCLLCRGTLWFTENPAGGSPRPCPRCLPAEFLACAPAATGESAGSDAPSTPKVREWCGRHCSLDRHHSGLCEYQRAAPPPPALAEPLVSGATAGHDSGRTRSPDALPNPAPSPPAGADPRAQGFREGVAACIAQVREHLVDAQEDGDEQGEFRLGEALTTLRALAPSSDTGSPDTDPERK